MPPAPRMTMGRGVFGNGGFAEATAAWSSTSRGSVASRMSHPLYNCGRIGAREGFRNSAVRILVRIIQEVGVRFGPECPNGSVHAFHEKSPPIGRLSEIDG